MAKVYDCKYGSVWKVRCVNPFDIGDVVRLKVDKPYNPDRVFIVVDFRFDESANDWEFEKAW